MTEDEELFLLSIRVRMTDDEREKLKVIVRKSIAACSDVVDALHRDGNFEDGGKMSAARFEWAKACEALLDDKNEPERATPRPMRCG